jgi:uncharacterized protein YecT (DUF1311 family)
MPLKLMISLIVIFLFINSSFSQTQKEKNQEAQSQYEKSDKKLNQVYQKILKEYAQDSSFIVALKKSQRLWIQFRDSELDMMFPDRFKSHSYGSVFHMCWFNELEQITKERIKRLQLWLDGNIEGDVCNGSIRER